ncbi:MAG: FIST C-terminal domain-containing protein [Marinilabiliaceae bacterium]|nr:FIST C-terminal domain-containing protein [Marinilabiliaceae bacterium]
MVTKSCYTTLLDPYRAGIEIGEQLEELQPEVIFLFASIHYKGSVELTEAIYEVLNNEKLIIIGNTGDGIYETNNIENIGVSALGINSNGTIIWNIALKTGIEQYPYKTAKECLFELQKMELEPPKFYFVASDFRTDGSQLINGISDFTDVPVIGGLAADDYSLKGSFVYVNKQVCSDTIAILSAQGDFNIDISVSQKMHEVGKMGQITKVEGTNIIGIDNMPAMDFVEREIGKPIGTVDEGIVAFKLSESPEANEYHIHSLFLPENQFNKSVHLYGSVKKGIYTKVCLAQTQTIIDDVKKISQHIHQLPFEPKASIIVSCAGRKRVLQSKIIEEMRAITSVNHELKSIVGFPSFGEFGPLKQNESYSKNYFHNMTFIILTIGD